MPTLKSLSLIFWLWYKILMASKQFSSVVISTFVKERISSMHSGNCFWRGVSNPSLIHHRQRTKKVVVWTKHIVSMANQYITSALHMSAPHPSLTMMQSWSAFGISTDTMISAFMQYKWYTNTYNDIQISLHHIYNIMIVSPTRLYLSFGLKFEWIQTCTCCNPQLIIITSVLWQQGQAFGLWVLQC